MGFHRVGHRFALTLERHLLGSAVQILLAALAQDVRVASYDEAVRLVGLCRRLEEAGWVIFERAHPRLQVGDMVLVEIALVIGCLDTEVCGEEEGAEFGDKLLLRVLRASEVRVASPVEGGWVTGGVGHLVQEDARERLIGAEGLARGDEDAVRMRGVGCAPLIARGLHDGAP